jgi:Fe-S cluster assembly ATP-binding protein
VTLLIKNFTVKSNNITLANTKLLELASGQMIMIAGRNGAGKSSFLKGLMSYSGYQVSGEVFFDGLEIATLPLFDKAKNGIHFVPQKTPNIAGLSLVKMLYGVSSNKENESIVSYKSKLEKKYQVLLSGDILTKPLETLSGGERKRSEMVTLLERQPKLLLLDEIDSGVDVDTQQVFAECLNNLKKNGCSIIVVSHNDNFMELLDFDKKYSFEDGELK